MLFQKLLKDMKYHKIQFYLFLIIILLISSIPGNSIPNTIALTWDKLIHVVEYSIFGLLGYRAFYKESNFKMVYLIGFGILFGCFDELWQQKIPGRFSSQYDVIADGLGVFFGVYAGNIFYK